MNWLNKSICAMKQQRNRVALTAALIAVAVLVVDQVVKFAVKLNMQIGEEINVIGSWCRLHFTENMGFAFGMSFGDGMGKLLLVLFRFLAVGLIVYLIVRMIRQSGRKSLIYSLTLICAGALGNIIDCCFYGLIFSESYYSVATLFPAGGGYAPFFHGRVVDMFYFPLFQFDWPQWMPFVGGRHFEFFNAIFNVADSAITIGVVWLIIDQIFFSSRTTKSEANERGAVGE